MGTAFGREGCFRTAAMATASMPPLLVVFLAAISHTRSVAEDQGQPRPLERAREEEEASGPLPSSSVQSILRSSIHLPSFILSTLRILLSPPL